MKDALRCSFCDKPTGAVQELVVPRKNQLQVGICDECVEVCGKILVKFGTGPVASPEKSTSFRVGDPQRDLLRCSFCATSQEKVARLIGATPGLTPAYICDKCVDLCFAVIAREVDDSATANTAPVRDWVARKVGVHKTTVHRIG